MEASNDLFINIIQNNPIVYDKSSKDFKNTKKKDQTWVTIANQCRMKVDDAKKRYFSMRQKYCREKRNLEVKRRNKEVVRKNWVYFDRLHFLDAFIQPRSTFTNDTGFDEGHGEDIVDGQLIGDFVQGGIDTAQNIDIHVQNGISANELNKFFNDDRDSFNFNTQSTIDHSENPNHFVEEILSEYTGEVSRVDHMCQSSRGDTFLESEVAVGFNVTAQTTNEEHQDIRESFNSDNYMSPNPITSTAHNNVVASSQDTGIIASTSRENSSTTVVPGTIIGIVAPPNSQKSDGMRTSSQQEMQPRRDLPVHKNASLRQNGMQSSSTLNQTAPISSTHKIASSNPTSTTATTKSLEAIRLKMDSCLNAINNKVSDKAQRSPHAPFLAYLGTKLTDVPKETIAALEREILQLVQYYSK